MADNLTRAQRATAMRGVKSTNTTPELVVRSLLRWMGLIGYRLHRRDIPGTPDVAWLGRRRALYVHGCFWHGHDCLRGARMPKTRRVYWRRKIERNRVRDMEQQKQCKAAGWRVLVLWECELRNTTRVRSKLRRFFSGKGVGKGV